VPALDPNTFGDNQPCFGCSPTHPIGLKLQFERNGDEVITRWTPDDRYQGPPGILHGGLVTTVADELAAWTIVGLKEQMGFTVGLEGRLKGPLRIGEEIVGTGRIDKDTSRIVTVGVELAQNDVIAFVGSFTFAVLDRAGAERLLGRQLPEAWQRFCRGR